MRIYNMNKKMSSPCGNVKKKWAMKMVRVVCALPSPKYLPLPIFFEKQRQVYLVKKISHCIYYTVNNREYICLILFTENVDGT